MKKSQISLYIIISLLIVIVIALIYYNLNTKKEGVIKADVQAQLEPAKVRDLVKSYIEQCLGRSFEAGKYFYGVNPDAKSRYEIYINRTIDDCIDLDNYRKLGLEILTKPHNVHAEITEEAVLITLDYPITIRVNEDTIEFRNFDFQLNKISSGILELDPDGNVNKDFVLFSPDKSVLINIPKGTKVTGNTENMIRIVMYSPQDSFFMNTWDKTYYRFEPAGAEFSPAIEIKFKYPPGYLSAMNQYLMKYCNGDNCIQVRTNRDVEKDLLIAEFLKFI